MIITLFQTHLRIVLFVFCFLVTASSFAATGDELIITGDIVNLRTGPSADAEAPIKLLQGRKVIEIQREDGWVEVETHREDIKTGWVHESLIAKITATAKQNRTLSNKRFKRFMQRFNDHNEVIKKQNGDIYFSNVKDKGDGTIEVIATEAWLDAEREERGTSLNEIFRLWSDVVPVGSSMSVIVFDKQGEQHMLMLR
jgi:uncharacterized protein YgiM (DUF1202 family)